MPKPNAFLLKMQEEFNARLAALKMQYEDQFKEERYFAKIFQMDLVYIALGRMGWGEKRIEQLDNMLEQVNRDLAANAKEDREQNNDPELWTAQDKFEKELQICRGSRYIKHEDRYRRPE